MIVFFALIFVAITRNDDLEKKKCIERTKLHPSKTEVHAFFEDSKISKQDLVEIGISKIKESKFSKKNLVKYLELKNVKDKDIILAQFALETA